MEILGLRKNLIAAAVFLILAFINQSALVAQSGKIDLDDLKKKLQDAKDADRMVIKSVEPKSKGPAVPRYGLTREDFKKLTKIVGMLGNVIPVRVVEHKAIMGELESKCQVVGTSPDLLLTESTKTVHGRFLTYKDTRTAENICVISEQAARQLFKARDPIGESVRIKGNFFTVVGVTRTKQPDFAKAALAKNDRVIFIPHTTMHLRFGDLHLENDKGSFKASNVQLHEIIICLNESSKSTEVFGEIASLFSKIHPGKDYTIQFLTKPN